MEAVNQNRNVTDRIVELDPTLKIHNESEWSGNPPGQYSAFNDAGVECEVGEFLYSFIRVLKPKMVLETGTHWGIAASYMALALKDNQSGQLDSIEFNEQNHLQAQRRMKTIDVMDFVSLYRMSISQFDPQGKLYKFMLLDTEPQLRFMELVRFFPNLVPGGFVFIHDLHRHMHQDENLRNNIDHPNEPFWPYGPIPEQIKNWVKDGQLRPFHFPTPRGLTGFYKVDPEDYKWL